MRCSVPGSFGLVEHTLSLAAEAVSILSGKRTWWVEPSAGEGYEGYRVQAPKTQRI